MPSPEETEVVRHLIRRCQDILTDLPADDRRHVEEAITTLRRGRAQLDTAIPVRFRGVVRHATPTLLPLTSRENRTLDG
jgi:hypothetical protein